MQDNLEIGNQSGGKGCDREVSPSHDQIVQWAFHESRGTEKQTTLEVREGLEYRCVDTSSRNPENMESNKESFSLVGVFI